MKKTKEVRPDAKELRFSHSLDEYDDSTSEEDVASVLTARFRLFFFFFFFFFYFLSF